MDIKFDIIKTEGLSNVELVNKGADLGLNGLPYFFEIEDIIIATSYPINSLKARLIKENLFMFDPGESFFIGGSITVHWLMPEKQEVVIEL